MRRGRRRGFGARITLLLLAAVLGLAGIALGRFWPDEQAQVFSGPAVVTDGDTLVVAGRTVRLQGLDAPETRQACTRDGRDWACGVEATRALRDHIGGRPVSCAGLGTDRFGRTLGRCRVEGQDIGAWMVRQGWAVAYRRYSDRYVPEELWARVHGRGIWAGSFETPEEWRHRPAR